MKRFDLEFVSDKYSVAVRFAKVRAAKEERSRRAEYLPTELFAEPAWDILLELYAFELVGRCVTERELTERIPVPSTVSIRWLKMLDAQNLVTRTVDVVDRTQHQIELTSKALNALDGYFSDKL